MLFDRHIASVSRFLRGKVDATAREDLTQSVFLSCLGPAVTLQASSSFRAYILRAARNRLIDHYAAHQRYQHRFDPMLQSVADAGPSPSMQMARHQQERVLLRGLRKLPLDLQLLLELHYWEDFSTAQLAEVLEIPQGTVKTRLWRARTLLRETIEGSERDPELVETTVGRLDDWARSLRDRPAEDDE
jgi:RNA polymerase sigma-70 factor (ECF subfamily)